MCAASLRRWSSAYSALMMKHVCFFEGRSDEIIHSAPAYFAQLEAPPGANISISLFFSLQDTATGIGSRASCLSDLFCSVRLSSGSSRGRHQTVCGIQHSAATQRCHSISWLERSEFEVYLAVERCNAGKIVRDEVGARRYRFVLFFGENWQLGTVRPFSLVRASLQLGKSMPDDDEKASAPVSTLPSLNEVLFLVSKSE